MSKASEKKPKKRFSVGDEVMGRWLGNPLWYEATIIATGSQLNTYILKFNDGQESELPISHIDTRGRFRPRGRSASPARRKSSPSRRKSSPGRRKTSPGRPRSRSKSPSRKRSPRKPSPARTTRSSVSKAVGKKEDFDEKPAATKDVKAESKPAGSVTVTTRTKVSRTPPRTAVGQQLEARMTRTALKQLEEHGINTESLRQELGRGSDEEKTSVENDYSYEFGGPIGATIMVFLLPLFVFATYFYCNKTRCFHISEIFNNPSISLPTWQQLLDPMAAVLFYGWILFQAFLYYLPLGKVVEGLPLKDNTKIKYPLNGFYALVISLTTFAACLHYKLPVVDFVYDKFLALITHACIFAIFASKLLWFKSIYEGTGLSDNGNTGNIFYDFFMGRQLNPSFLGIDLKYFFECRPGLIGWVLIDLVMALKLYESSSEVNLAIAMLCLFHFIYVADALWFEESMLTMPDITFEGLGYMLLFGQVVWIPFIFSLPVRLLADHPYTIPTPLLVIALALNGIGFVIYRVANLQKDLYRLDPRHPAIEHLETMSTEVCGQNLLIGGWWGYVRHPNYLGDIIMAWAWAFICGFKYFFPYIYPLYLTILLVHRSYRVEAKCRRKYGLSWEEYCKRVPYRLFPNIF